MATSYFHFVLTLTGSAQQLDDVLPATPTGNRPVFNLTLQPGAANANPIFIGDADVAADSYAVRMPAPTGGDPPAPFQIESPRGTPLTLSQIYVIGTADETVHIGVIQS